VLIKVREVKKPQNGFPMLQPASHPNIIGLVEAFYDDGFIYLTYNYSGHVVSLLQVMSTPTVKLNEPEIATICWAVLLGLEYLHNRLKLGHGNIKRSNIVLLSDGTVKIGEHGAFSSCQSELMS
jgi:serine/threonine protein kinase